MKYKDPSEKFGPTLDGSPVHKTSFSVAIIRLPRKYYTSFARTIDIDPSHDYFVYKASILNSFCFINN